MFSFLSSEHRTKPVFASAEKENEGMQETIRRSIMVDRSIVMFFQTLKSAARETVDVYR